MGDGEGGVDHSVHMDGVEAESEAQPGASRSYAAAMTGLKAEKETSKSVLSSDDIVVLDEDVLVDESGPYTELCGNLGDAKEPLAAQGSHSFPFSGAKHHEVSTEELYGPWMVVGDKKRCPRKLHDTNKGVESSFGKSRFDALATEEAGEADIFEVVECDADHGVQYVVHDSAKAGTSSTTGRRAATKVPQSNNRVVLERETSNVVVESMVPGRTPLVIGDSLGSKGQHKAVTIVEDGIDLEGSKRAGIKKGSSGTAKLKLQVRKQSDFKAPNLPLLSEWITSLSSGGMLLSNLLLLITRHRHKRILLTLLQLSILCMGMGQETGVKAPEWFRLLTGLARSRSWIAT
ncbi:hypothetical protein V6N13_085089 [Hibiscus sabdariffa]